MPTLISYVEHLADTIGPRPAATDAEARAAEYIEDVFRARGLEVERQEFDTPRTYSWAYAVYHLLTVAAAGLALKWPVPGLVLAVAAAVLLSLDLDTWYSVARLLPKGPSQNVIARHIPRARRGEQLRRVVLIAHYDTGKTSIGSSPALVKRAGLLLAIARWTTIAVAIAVLLALMPFTAGWKPWLGYATLALAVYPLLMLLAHLYHALLGRPVEGANDNASGVAALFGIMQAIVPEPDVSPFQARRRSLDDAYDAGVVPADVTVEYRSASRVASDDTLPADAFGDISWETTAMPAVTLTPSTRPTAAGDDDWAGSSDTASLWEEPAGDKPSPSATSALRAQRSARPQASPVPARWDARPADSWADDEDDVDSAQERFSFGADTPAPEPPADEQSHGISSWLGLGKGYDVRKAGKRIGSWDKFSEDDEDEFGFKAGTAGDFSEDSDTTDVAARIRRRVTESVDRSLAEKEIWFVATGADEAGGWGTRAFADEYGDFLEDALIINISSVGAGSVSFVTEEGAGKLRRADRRLVGQAKRTARENDLPVKGRSHAGQDTSITPLIARRFKAMTVKAFDINGRVPNRHQDSDVTATVREETIDAAVGFITALLREI